MEISLIGILKLLQVYSTDLWPTKMINLSVMEYFTSINGRTMRPKSKTLYERRCTIIQKIAEKDSIYKVITNNLLVHRLSKIENPRELSLKYQWSYHEMERIWIKFILYSLAHRLVGTQTKLYLFWKDKCPSPSSQMEWFHFWEGGGNGVLLKKNVRNYIKKVDPLVINWKQKLLSGTIGSL